MSYTGTGFAKWLHGYYDPVWKRNLENCDYQLFKELNITKDELEKILEKLDEYEIFNDHLKPWKPD